MSNQTIYDCVIIGAGPAGLTAAIYLGRFKCNFITIDNGNSRAALIPRSHNYPGFVKGIAGKELLKNLRIQAANYGNQIIEDTATEVIQNKNKTFSIKTIHSTIHAKTIIVATGVVDIEPDLPNLKSAIQTGLIRHCPICDAYEVSNQKIAVICSEKRGFREAQLLCNYSSHVTLFTLGKKLNFTADETKQVEKMELNIVCEPVIEVVVIKNRITSLKTEKSEYFFDTIYSALGSKIRTELLINLGAKHTTDFCIKVDEHQQTSIPGIFAAGDIVDGLNQICVATSQAAVAAVSVFNKLRGCS